MKKFILSFFVIGCFALYTVYYGSGGSLIYVPAQTTTAVTNNNSVANNSILTKTQTQTSTQSNATVHQTQTKPTTSIAINSGLFKDGTYTGNSVNAYYGNIQVEAIVNNGVLSDVVFLDYPQDRGNSIRVNSYAMPILKSEAIQAQSSNVNIVSGATHSSEAFIKSLTSALSQAKA